MFCYSVLCFLVFLFCFFFCFSLYVCVFFTLFCYFHYALLSFSVSFVFVLFRPHALLSLQAGVYPVITVLKPLKGKVLVLNICMIYSLCTVREKI